jgi:hypothetical protein
MGEKKQSNKINDNKLAAPCGLYCSACIDYLVYNSCHGCGCDCETCSAARHHERCEIFKCCVEQKGHETCSECKELPCSMLIRFCYNPVWLHHLPVIENLRRQKTIGAEKWLKEQKETWSNQWYLQRWLWYQKECEDRLERSLEKSKNMFPQKK